MSIKGSLVPPQEVISVSESDLCLDHVKNITNPELTEAFSGIETFDNLYIVSFFPLIWT